MKLGGAPRVFITPEAKQKLDLYIRLCPEEISGLGQVEHRSSDLLITEVYLFEQEVSQVSTDLSQEDVAKWLIELIEAGEDPAEIKLWWHSHRKWRTFWSPTDQGTASCFANGWMISIVGNQQGEYKVRLDIYKPFHLTFDDLPLEIEVPEDEGLRGEVEAEIKEKVRYSPIGRSIRWPWQTKKGR